MGSMEPVPSSDGHLGERVLSQNDPRGLNRMLREQIASTDTYVVPGAANALTARIIEDLGFRLLYVTGAGIANSFLGVPDIGLISLGELATHVSAIRNAVNIPIIVDCDTGFGNAVNVWHTVRTIERAGANAIQLEDQTFPKRCGHFDGKDVVETAEMVAKISAAVDARVDPDVVIVARTDARAVHGLAEACERGRLYHEAGADVVFVEGPENTDEIAAVARAVDAPLLLNIVEGGVTPDVSASVANTLGYKFVLYANLPLLGAIRGTQDILGDILQGSNGPGRSAIATWDNRQQLVRKPFFDDLERHYWTGE